MYVCVHACMYVYTYLYTDILLFDFIAVFWNIYHQILRTDFLPKTAKDCFFLSQEICGFAKITAVRCLKFDSGHVKKQLALGHCLQQWFLKDLEIK